MPTSNFCWPFVRAVTLAESLREKLAKENKERLESTDNIHPSLLGLQLCRFILQLLTWTEPHGGLVVALY